MCILPTSLSTLLITTLITTINHPLHYTITIFISINHPLHYTITIFISINHPLHFTISIPIPILTPHRRPSLDFKKYDWRWELRAADEKKKLQLKLMEYEKKKDGSRTPKP
jgi:hypothetical protein